MKCNCRQSCAIFRGLGTVLLVTPARDIHATKKIKVDACACTYPNEVIVPLEANTDGVFAPGHGLGDVWDAQVTL